MTKVEAIKFGTAWLGIQEKLKGSDTYEFFKMSVKALQEKPKSEWQHDHEILKAHSDGANEVLDIIRAEIAEMPKTYPFVNHFNAYVKVDDVMEIIDKYKSESEE